MQSGQLIRLVSSDDLEALIGAFLDDCELARLSPRTIRFYGSNLRRYHWWCVQTGASLDPTRHTPAHIRAFLRYVQTAEQRWDSRWNAMSNRGVSDRTHHAYHRTLSRFYNWLVEQEYLDVSPMARVRAPRVRQEQPDPFSDEELERLAAVLRAAGDGVLATRDRAIVAVLLDLGLRASELAGIEVPHLSMTTGDLYVAHGKGNKSRRLRLGPGARRHVRRYWLRWRRQAGEEGALFLSDAWEPLTGQGIHHITTTLGKRAGVHPCNPHRFRHTMAVNAIRAGMGLLELQQILGHTSLDMVRRYVKLAEGDIARATQKHSPFDHMRLGL